jgi:hypothetical protein
MKITLTELTPKKTKSGVDYWACKDNSGNTYSIWDEELAGKMVIGSPMDLEIKTSPQGYSNIRGMIGQSVPQSAPTATVQPKAGEFRSSREDSIIAQCLTKVWAEMDGETKPSEIFLVYKEFLKHLDE